MPSNGIESRLEPGEEVPVELTVSGWPRLSGRAAWRYGTLLMPACALIIMCPSVGWEWATRGPGAPGTRVEIPMLVLMLALFLVLELLRGARFRTTVWTVTSDGVECVRGLFALRPCFRLPLAAVRRVELPDGDPELLTDEGPVRLEGVGAACLPALLRALPDAEHGITEPEILAKGRSRRRDVAFAVALILLLTLVQVVRLHERGTRQAASFLLKVRKAVDAAQWDTQRELERLSSKEVAGGVHAVGSESSPGTAEFDVKLYWLAPGQGFRLGHHPDRPIQVSGVAVDVSVRADHHHGMLPDSPTIELATGTATNNDIFVNELRTALEEAGLPTPRITTTPVGPEPGK